MTNKEIPRDPSKEEIKFILELIEINKIYDAEKNLNKIITKYPNSAILYNILGGILVKKNKLEEAILNCEKSIKINPNYPEPYNNLGIALQKLNKTDAAIENYKKSIELKKNFIQAHHNLGSAYIYLDEPQNSLQHFNKALELNPLYAEAYNGLGAANEKLGKKKDALKYYKKAIEIKPKYSEAYYNLGTLLSAQSNYDEAIVNLEKAIKLNNNYEKAYNNLGNVFNILGMFEEANNAYQQAIKIKPDYAKAYSNLLFNLIYKPSFDIDYYLSEAKKFRLNCGIKQKSKINYKYEINPKKLKVGFVSADFGDHPGGYFTLNFLKELKKKNCDLIAYPTVDRNDEFSNYFKNIFSKWDLIKNKTDKAAAEQIIDDGIHILIDAQGHSAKNRLPIFIYKPAPIQITWLGQGSTGIPEIDYFVGNNYITPRQEESHYVEKILRLPKASQCFTPPDFNLQTGTLPAIKNNFITFGCINKLSKINDEVIDLWSKILLLIPKSKLLLKNKVLDNKTAFNNIVKKFEKNKVKKEQLILEGESKNRKELLITYNKIDIALDPFPFQGNTTSIEAIWMGVPVITLKGNRYLFHFGESINSNLKMINWVASSKDDYILKAKNFSSNLKNLEKTRLILRKIFYQSPLFDAKSFCEDFNNMLWKIWKDFESKR